MPPKAPAKKKSTKPERVLILRTCDSKGKSYNGFQWPKSGRVEAPDWKKTKECGHGLHGFLRGEGDGSLASFDVDAVWIAAWVDAALVVDLDGKVKFPWAEVAVYGTREDATNFPRANGCGGAIVGGTATTGYGGTATTGSGGTATTGYRGILNIRWWSAKSERYRIATFYVGEDNIQPNTKYGVDDAGKVVLR